MLIALLLSTLPAAARWATAAPSPPGVARVGIVADAAATADRVGRLSVAWSHNPSTGVCERTVFLTDAAGVTERIAVSDAELSARGGLDALVGRKIAASLESRPGVLHTKGLALRSIAALPDPKLEANDAVENTEGRPSKSGGVSAQATVAKPYVTLLMRFADRTAITPNPRSYYQGLLLSTTYPGMDHYFREQSHTSMSLAGSAVMDWMNLPRPKSYYLSASDPNTFDLEKLLVDAVLTADSSVNFNLYDGIIVSVNEASPSGASFGGQMALNLDGVYRTRHYVVGANLTKHLGLAHDMGHSLGFDHVGPYPNSGADSTFNRWTPMSKGYKVDPAFPDYGPIAVGYTAYHKMQAGWITGSRVVRISPGMNQTVLLERQGQPTSLARPSAIVIYLGGGQNYYVVESRRIAGYDATGGLPAEGVIIHRVTEDSTTGVRSVIEDITANNNPNDAGAVWLPGETFTDAAWGVSVQVNSAFASGYSVTASQLANVPPPNRVTRTTDSGPGSLRSVLTYANAIPSTQVQFAIPTTDPNYSGGVFTITPSVPLPRITAVATRVDGTTQTSNVGNTNADGPEILIDGTNAGDWANGFDLASSDGLVRGFVIGRFKGDGVKIAGTGALRNKVEGCYLGVTPAGNAAFANQNGVEILQGAKANILGDGTLARMNIISGNSMAGVSIGGTGTSGNALHGNRIGTSYSGNAALPNQNGVIIGTNASENAIGASGLGNLISGNKDYGVTILEATGNRVQGNRIGLNADANAVLPNNYGVFVWGGSKNTLIGSPALGDRNIISGNKSFGVIVQGAGTDNTLVQGNYIGTTPNGSAALPNGSLGVGVFFSAKNTSVGGTAAGAGNVISGNNGVGVAIGGAGTQGNRVQGNYIGTDRNGTAALPNVTYGIGIWGGASSNRIGDISAAGRNVISGNGNTGVLIQEAGTTRNVVWGNFIGLNNAGTAAIPNGFGGVGIQLGATNNTIGGTTAGMGNIISGNQTAGLYLVGDATTANAVQGNFIGTNAAGNGAVPNGNGVELFGGPKSNTIGGTVAAARNVISGNRYHGVAINGVGTNSNLVQGNYIGVDPAGNVAYPNQNGIGIWGGAIGNYIGGAGAGMGNVISGNSQNGVNLSETNTRGNRVQGNRIGTNAAGLALIPNNQMGVSIKTGARTNTIGGTTAAAGNVIAGSGLAGIEISGVGTTGNIVQGNNIGCDATGQTVLPNGNGISLEGGTTANIIGGIAAGAGNRIHFNIGPGVHVEGVDTVRNALRGNSWHSNGSLGIDLTIGDGVGMGVSPNDTGDGDTGGNGLQNYPVLTAASRSGNTLTIQGTLDSTPSTAFFIDLYGCAAADGSGFGEGEVYLGSVAAATNAAGVATFTATLPGDFALVTATATKQTTNDTSEFSAAKTVAAAARTVKIAPRQ
jgi:M6 family metalloprotease-like protein